MSDQPEQIKVSLLRCRHDGTELLMLNDTGSCPKCGMGYFEVLFEQILPIPDEIQSQIALLQEEIAGRKHDYNDLFKISKAKDVENERLRGVLTKKEDASQKLCEIYFNIAAGAIGEDAVRAKREAALKGPE